MLEIEGLVAGYGATRVIHGLSLRVLARGVTVMLGANGAGKTTLMKTLAGLVKPVSGRLRFMGEDITETSSHCRVTAGMVLVPEGRMVFPSLSVRENLRLGAINARALSDWRRTLDHVYHVFPRLLEREAQQAITLSGGEQQMLAIARALLTNPGVMMLDEPSEGLAPLVVRDVRDAIVEIHRQGMAILLVEQKVAIPVSIGQRIYVVDHGTIGWSGTTAEFAAARADIETKLAI